MNQLSTDARLRLDVYLAGVRRAVAGTSVDPSEVERDIRDHIDSALRNADAPVSRATLDEVLARLGDPTQWVPDEELPAWRRVWRRVAFGPEEWRLPYLSFALTVFGLILVPVGVGVLLILAAWFVSRAALDLPTLRADTDDARKWLLYPPLVFVAVFSVILMFGGLAVPLMAWGVGGGGVEKIFGAEVLSRTESFRLHAGWVLASFGAWWLVLSGLVALLIRPLRRFFHPFATWLRRSHALALAAIALLIGALGAFLLRVGTLF
ncbi:MAG: hypothetical protein ABR517_09535 [Thermoanaerobaculia bacterium]